MVENERKIPDSNVFCGFDKNKEVITRMEFERIAMFAGLSAKVDFKKYGVSLSNQSQTQCRTQV